MLEQEYEYHAKVIFESSLEVHRHLGPGLLESAYQAALEMELRMRKLDFSSQVRLPLYYKGRNTGKEYVIDLLVANEIIVECKAVEMLLPVHTAQVISYLKLSRKNLGFLINFNVPLIKDGFKRIVYEYFPGF